MQGHLRFGFCLVTNPNNDSHHDDKNMHLTLTMSFFFDSHSFFYRYRLFDNTQQPDQITKCNGIDRLKKRIGNYRQHHTICGPRFDQSFNGACEQQSIETVVLQKRFLENKAKKAAKKADKKQLENAQVNNLQNSVQVVSFSQLNWVLDFYA